MFQIIFIFLSVNKQIVYSASWFPQNKDQTPNTKKQKENSRGTHKETEQKRGRKRSWEPADPWEGRGKRMGHSMPRSSCKAWVSYNQRLAPPNHILKYERDSKQTETSPCPPLNRDGVRVQVVVDGRVDWRLGRGDGKITSLYFTYFMSFRKTIQAVFQLSTGLGTPAHSQHQKEEVT